MKNTGKIQIHFFTEKTLWVLTHEDFTDDFEDFLHSRGKKVLSIHYGYANTFDLIIYEV